MCSSMIVTRGLVGTSELVEVAARDKRDLHRLEVIAANDADVGVDEFRRQAGCGLRR